MKREPLGHPRKKSSTLLIYTENISTWEWINECIILLSYDNIVKNKFYISFKLINKFFYLSKKYEYFIMQKYFRFWSYFERVKVKGDNWCSICKICKFSKLGNPINNYNPVPSAWIDDKPNSLSSQGKCSDTL